MTTLRPADLAPGRVTIQNDGNVTVSYAIEVSIGRQLPGGFQSEVSRSFFSRAVQPGETTIIPAPVTLPENITSGGKTVRVRLGTVGPTGSLQNVLAQEFFSGRFGVGLPETPMIEGMLPLMPGELPPVLGLSQNDVGIQQPTANPNQVMVGDTVNFVIPVFVQPVEGLTGAVLAIQTMVIQNGQTVAALPDQEFDVTPGATNRLTSQWVVPEGTEPGGYGLRVRIFDPNTVMTLGDLVDQTFTNLFSVLAGLLPAPTGPLFGRPTLNVFPFSVSPGETTRARVRISNVSPNPLSPQLQSSILSSTGGVVRSLPTTSLSLNPLEAIDQQISIDTSNLPSGLYGIRISLADPATGATLLSPVDFPTGFQVEGVAAPTAPTGADRPPTPAEVTMSFRGSDPRSPEQGDRVRLLFSITNSGPGLGGTVLVRGFPRDATGQNQPDAQTSLVIGSNGQSSGFELFINVPQNSPAGPWSIRMFVEDSRTFVAGQPSTFLVNQSFSDIFRVQAPFVEAEPAPTPPPAAPAPTVAPRLEAVRPATLSPSTVSPGGLLAGRWSVRNPLGITVRALLFLDGPGGGSGSAISIGPGSTTTLSVARRVPTNQSPGTFTYGLAVRDANTQQTLSGLVQTFRITVSAPVVEEEPVADGIVRGQLTVTAPRGDPSTVSKGGITNITFFIRNRSDLSANLTVLGFMLDSNGAGQGTLRSTVSVTPRGDTRTALSFRVPTTSAAGPMRMQLFIWDPRTFVSGQPSTFLINETFSRVINVV